MDGKVSIVIGRKVAADRCIIDGGTDYAAFFEDAGIGGIVLQPRQGFVVKGLHDLMVLWV